MNTKNTQENKIVIQIWSWILAVIGGLITLVGLLIIVGVFATRNQVYSDQIIILVLGFVAAIAFFAIGVPSLILGIWRFFIREVKSRRKWGRTSIIVGSLYTLLGIVILIGLILEPDTDIPGFYLLVAIPFLVLGIPSIILGVKEQKPTVAISTGRF